MQTYEIIAHYGTQQKVADALDVKQSNIAKWLKSGRPPYLRQLQVQILTKGKLKAERKPTPNTQSVN